LDEAQLDKCVTRVVALVLAARQTRAHKVRASDGL
jgi:hypothetical protein